MSSLSDHVDRISLLARNIRSNATSAAPEASGPFTEAVLQTPLGNLIRDIDPAELGLFTLVSHAKPIPDAEPTGPPHGEIARAEFHGATPLKKPPAPTMGRQNVQRTGEHEPEVYARAAVKYLDKYQSIRPMPRASEQAMRIIEQLEIVRENIRKMNDELKQHAASGTSETPASPKATIKKEEERIQEVQAQIANLKKRRDAVMKQKATAKMSRTRPKPKPHTPPPPPPDAQEETFWNTPAAAARTLHFVGDSLLDEEVDVGDISAVSFASPVPARSRARSILQSEVDDVEDEPTTQDFLEEREELRHIGETEAANDDDEMSDEDEEQTVVLSKLLPTSSEVANPDQPASLVQPPSPPPPVSEHPPFPETVLDSLKRSKVKITTELEHIVSRIWATIGELIMPGHPFDVTGSGGNRPPRAKETIAHLQTLSTRTPAPASPYTSSLSSFSHGIISSSSATTSPKPTAQQVLTAHMLLALLSASPSYSMPLVRLKEQLSTKSAGTGIGAVGGSGVTRPIYGCVAKRLLKIDRGGGEQVVKFDV